MAFKYRWFVLMVSVLPGICVTGCFFGLQDFEGQRAGPDGCITGYVERDGRCYRPDMSVNVPNPVQDMGDEMEMGVVLDMRIDMPVEHDLTAFDMTTVPPEDMVALDMEPPDPCMNGARDPGEVGVDCGGRCARPCATCSDGVRNQDEEGIDCGGNLCMPCESCSDGIQNQDEEGVDCGGSVCDACPTCTDGIKNQDEEGIDCGGSVCAGCMVSFPRSTFMMGDDVGSPDAFPVHGVTLSAFSIDRTEVTVAAYRRCVQAGECEAPSTNLMKCNYDEPDREQHPVMCASWMQAVTYCAWVGKRLPTEAEWEFSAVGRAGRDYPWGSQDVDCTRAVLNEFNGNPAGCGAGSTQPVDSLPAGRTPEGIADLIGNADEWVSDWYDASYYQNSPTIDPQGPETGTEKVVRGYFYNNNINGIRTRRRFSKDPSRSSSSSGFRCARSE